MSKYTIPVMVVSTKKGLYTFFAEGPKHIHFWAVINMFLCIAVKLFLKHPVFVSERER
jgi:hypothetical protein